MAETLDVVVVGATGFTGRLVVEYLHRTYGVDGPLRWGMAGRSVERLEALRRSLTASDRDVIPIRQVDTQDAAQAAALARSARVVCTTVGPYALLGTELVAACAQHGTHYCDLTGEVQWMRRMIDRYHDMATNAGARIVHACGFDCVVSDLGVHFIQQKMHERHGVYGRQVKLRVQRMQGGISGGTFASALNVIREAIDDVAVREVLSHPYSLNPAGGMQGGDRPDAMGARYDADLASWQAPFVMAPVDTRVVRRSHALRGLPFGDDFIYDEGVATGPGATGYLRALIRSAQGLGFMALLALPPTRYLISRIAPAPGQGPERDTIDRGGFDMLLLSKHPSDSALDLMGYVRGSRDPGYGATSEMLAESAVCLALDDLATPAGVLTPAVAMGEKLVDRLQANTCVTFEVSED